MAEVLYGHGGVVRGVEICRWAVVRPDPGHQCLRNCVLRASYPIFDLAIFFRRPGNDDVHAIFKIESVSGSDCCEGKNKAQHKRAFALSWRAHVVPCATSEP